MTQSGCCSSIWAITPAGASRDGQRGALRGPVDMRAEGVPVQVAGRGAAGFVGGKRGLQQGSLTAAAGRGVVRGARQLGFQVGQAADEDVRRDIVGAQWHGC
jgi:hypothetical protein